MHTIRPLLIAVLLAISVHGCSRGPQGDPEDAAPVRALIERLDADLARLQALFEMREELRVANAQLASTQQELARDFPQITAAGKPEAAPLPAAARNRVRTFRASVAEYDRLVARHNELAGELEPYLDGRSPQDVQRVVRAMEQLRARLAEMLDEADYTRAVYMARHSELVQALDLDEPLQR